MKNLLTIKKILNPKKEIVALILCLFLLKLSLAGYFLVKSGRFSSITFLDQAVAQEKAVEVKVWKLARGNLPNYWARKKILSLLPCWRRRKKI